MHKYTENYTTMATIMFLKISLSLHLPPEKALCCGGKESYTKSIKCTKFTDNNYTYKHDSNHSDDKQTFSSIELKLRRGD